MVTQRSMLSSWMIDSHLFRSISIGPPLPEIRLFQTLTFKLQAQGHGCGQRARSCTVVGPVSNWFASLSFHINHANNSWDSAISKYDLEKFKVNVMGEVKVQSKMFDPVSSWCISLSFHANRTKHSWDMANRECLTLKEHIRNYGKKSTKMFSTELHQNLIR